MASANKIVNRKNVDLRPFAGLARMIAANPQAWLDTEHLLADLVRNSREPIPKAILDHVRYRLNGKAKKRQGRGLTKSAHTTWLAG